MGNTELKPCPFCGERKLLEIRAVEIDERPECKFIGVVTCLECYGRALAASFECTEDEAKEAAIKAWTRRAEL